MKLRSSLLARSAVVLTVVGFAPLPAAAVTQSEVLSSQVAAVAAVGYQTGRGRRAPQGNAEAAVEPRTGPEVISEAQAVLAATNTTCDVINAVSPGKNGDINIYEVACASGMGHVLTDGEQPTSRNCLITAQQAAEAAAENPEAARQVTCSLPENANPEEILEGYIQTAGLTCTVEESRWVGRTSSGEDRYEVGCADADGYWLRANNAGEYQGSLECLEVVEAGGECRFTTPDEQMAHLGARFASVAPQTCSPDAGRFVGANEEFRFYEVKCAEGFGFIAQTNPEGEPLSARDCGRPQIVPGGCTLTDSSAAQAEASQARAETLATIGKTCTVNQDRIVGVENPTDGSPGREIYELDCTEQPLGLMAFFPTEQGVGEVEAFDCLTVDARGLDCEFTPREMINTVLTQMVTASERNCNVVDFRMVARMSGDNGDVGEVKCDDGRGWFGEFPDDREVAGQLLPCAAAARQGDECVL